MRRSRPVPGSPGTLPPAQPIIRPPPLVAPVPSVVTPLPSPTYGVPAGGGTICLLSEERKPWESPPSCARRGAEGKSSFVHVTYIRATPQRVAGADRTGRDASGARLRSRYA